MKTILRFMRGPGLAVGLAALPAAARAAEEGGIVPQDYSLQIWTLITFAVLLVLLAKFAFKPIAEALDRHLIILSAGPYAQVTRIIPPLVTTQAEVETAIRILGESLVAAGA